MCRGLSRARRGAGSFVSCNGYLALGTANAGFTSVGELNAAIYAVGNVDAQTVNS